MSGRRVLRGVAANVFDKLVITGTQVALVPVMALHWGLQTYGGWVMLATIPSFLAVSDFGFATAAGNEMAMLVARGERERALQVFQSAWILVVVSSLAMAVLATGVAMAVPADWLPVTTGYPASETRLTLIILILWGIISLQASIFASAWRSTGLFSVSAMASALMFLAENLAMTAVVLLGGRPVAAALALLVARVVAIFVQLLVLRRYIPWLPLGFAHARRSIARELAVPALAVLVLPLAQAAVLQGSALMIGIAVSQAAVPAFTATRTLSRVGLQFTQLLNHALMPEYSAAVGRSDRIAQAKMVVLTLLASAAVLVPFALVLSIWGNSIVQLWTGNMIRPGTDLLVAMSATVVLGGIWAPLSNLILAMNRHASYSYPYVICAALVMPLTYVLSRRFGAAGGGWAIAMLDLAMCIIVYRISRALLPSWPQLREAAHALLAQRHRLIGQ